MTQVIIDREVAEPEPAPAEKLQPESPPIKVLLIEDNPGDARLIELMLADAGGDFFQLERAERLAVGLRRLERDGIGVVLLDLSLPDSRGLATFSQMHAHAPNIPIIV